MTLELHCTKCDSYFGWYPDDEAGYADAMSRKTLHESSCVGNEELMLQMREQIKARKAVYDALDDDTNNRVIANSGTESLQTAGSVDKESSYPQLDVDGGKLKDWSTTILLVASPELPGRMAEALIALDECNYDHDCGGEGDYPRCKECRAVRLLRTMILELGTHGIGR
jgi:hypothetical protein